MLARVPDILSRIVADKVAALPQLRAQLETLEWQAGERRASRRDFRAALVGSQPAIIAEIKQASPSKGVLTENFEPARIARAYADGGAAALSVLTDEKYFHGSLDHLESARDAVSIPVLRKDFTVDDAQVVEAAARGADAVLLIAAVLKEASLRRLRELAASYGMAALVEVHDEQELAPALNSGAGIVGVNNRNLHTFEVTLETSLRLAEQIPAGVVKVSESGIRSSADVKRLTGAGYQAFLVGEHLMKAGDPAGALRDLRS